MIREDSLVDDVLDILPNARAVLRMNGVELDDEDIASTVSELADRYGLSTELLLSRLLESELDDDDDSDDDDEAAWGADDFVDAPIYEPSRSKRQRDPQRE